MRLGPAPTTSSRHQPRTAHNAVSPRARQPHPTTPEAAAARTTPDPHRHHPPSSGPSRDHAKTTADHGGGRRAGRQARRLAGGRANRTRLAAHGERLDGDVVLRRSAGDERVRAVTATEGHVSVGSSGCVSVPLKDGWQALPCSPLERMCPSAESAVEAMAGSRPASPQVWLR